MKAAAIMIHKVGNNYGCPPMTFVTQAVHYCLVSAHRETTVLCNVMAVCRVLCMHVVCCAMHVVHVCPLRVFF